MQKCSRSHVQSVGFIRQRVKSAEQRLAKYFAASLGRAVSPGDSTASQVKEREMKMAQCTWIWPPEYLSLVWNSLCFVSHLGRQRVGVHAHLLDPDIGLKLKLQYCSHLV